MHSLRSVLFTISQREFGENSVRHRYEPQRLNKLGDKKKTVLQRKCEFNLICYRKDAGK